MHIDIGEIDHVQYPATGGQDFAWLSDAILNAAVAGGFQLAIVNIGEDPPLGRLGGFDAGLRLNNAGAGSFDGGAESARAALESAKAQVSAARAAIEAARTSIIQAQTRVEAAQAALAARTALSASLICAAASRRCSFSTRVSILASTSPWCTN